MAMYVVLVHFTQQGVETMKAAPIRIWAARQAVEDAGGKLHAVYYTMGRFDAVAILEAPDDVTASRLALATGMEGNIRTETLKAFNEEEFADILAGIP